MQVEIQTASGPVKVDARDAEALARRGYLERRPIDGRYVVTKAGLEAYVSIRTNDR